MNDKHIELILKTLAGVVSADITTELSQHDIRPPNGVAVQLHGFPHDCQNVVPDEKDRVYCKSMLIVAIKVAILQPNDPLLIEHTINSMIDWGKKLQFDKHGEFTATTFVPPSNNELCTVYIDIKLNEGTGMVMGLVKPGGN